MLEYLWYMYMNVCLCDLGKQERVIFTRITFDSNVGVHVCYEIS